MSSSDCLCRQFDARVIFSLAMTHRPIGAVISNTHRFLNVCIYRHTAGSGGGERSVNGEWTL